MKTMPIGMPIANSFSTSRRRTTAITQTATVTQNKKTGSQPATIEVLPTFTCPRARARARAATATATAAQTARTQRRGRDGLVVCWFVVSVWVLIVGGSTVGRAETTVPRETP